MNHAGAHSVFSMSQTCLAYIELGCSEWVWEVGMRTNSAPSKRVQCLSRSPFPSFAVTTRAVGPSLPSQGNCVGRLLERRWLLLGKNCRHRKKWSAAPSDQVHLVLGHRIASHLPNLVVEGPRNEYDEDTKPAAQERCLGLNHRTSYLHLHDLIAKLQQTARQAELSLLKESRPWAWACSVGVSQGLTGDIEKNLGTEQQWPATSSNLACDMLH